MRPSFLKGCLTVRRSVRAILFKSIEMLYFNKFLLQIRAKYGAIIVWAGIFFWTMSLNPFVCLKRTTSRTYVWPLVGPKPIHWKHQQTWDKGLFKFKSSCSASSAERGFKLYFRLRSLYRRRQALVSSSHFFTSSLKQRRNTFQHNERNLSWIWVPTQMKPRLQNIATYTQLTLWRFSRDLAILHLISKILNIEVFKLFKIKETKPSLC